MDSELWRRLGYPRRLRDGSFAVSVGLFGDWYRLTSEQFRHYADGYARPLVVDGLRDGGFAIAYLCLFILPAGAGLAGCLAMSLPGLLFWAVDAHKRAVRFGEAFRPVRNVEILDKRWSGYELCVTAVRNRHAVAWGAYTLLLGWLTDERYPLSLMQSTPLFDWPAYTVIAGLCFAAGLALLAARLYYWRTHGHALSPENVGRAERGAAYMIKA